MFEERDAEEQAETLEDEEETLERCDALLDDPFLAELAECENVTICDDPLKDWQKEALDSYGTALKIRAQARWLRMSGDKLRRHRARSCVGGRRRPGRRRSTRAASRSAGGGDPDEPGPGEDAGAQYLAAKFRSPRKGPG